MSPWPSFQLAPLQKILVAVTIPTPLSGILFYTVTAAAAAGMLCCHCHSGDCSFVQGLSLKHYKRITGALLRSVRKFQQASGEGPMRRYSEHAGRPVKIGGWRRSTGFQCQKQAGSAGRPGIQGRILSRLRRVAAAMMAAVFVRSAAWRTAPPRRRG